MTRQKRTKLSASLEDYIEAIFNLVLECKVARSKEIAQKLNVSRSSVTGALRLLKDKGLANHEPYGYVTLTDAGSLAAVEIVKKHNILKSFFEKVLGVESGLAQDAACRAEHALGQEIIARLLSYVEFVRANKKSGHHLADEFQKFCADRRLDMPAPRNNRSGEL